MILIQTKEKMLPTVLKKTFFKTADNSSFGKTIANSRKRIKFRLVLEL